MNYVAMSNSKYINLLSFVVPILYPFGALIYALAHLKKNGSKYILFTFIVFFGYVFISEGTGNDGAHYAQLIQWAYSLDNVSFLEFFSLLSSHDNVDYFNPLLTFIVSRFTSSAHIYFMIYAAIWGSLYIKTIYIVLQRKTEANNWLFVLIVASFAMVSSINEIGGVRMPMATQLFVFGALRYFLCKSKWGILWLCLSLFAHFSYFSFVLAFLVFLLIKKIDVRYFFFFFLFAHLLNSVDVDFVQNLFTYLPGNISERLMVYTHENNLEQMAEGGKFYLGDMNLWGKLDSMILRAYIFVSFCFFFVGKNSRNAMRTYYTEFGKFSMFIYSVALILANMPSGYRFVLPAGMICMAYIIMMLSHAGLWNAMRRINICFAPFLLLFLLHRLRFILDLVGVSLFFSNYITMFFIEDNTSVLRLLKGFI